MTEEETLEVDALRAWQRRRLAAVLNEALATDGFYRRKLGTTAFNPERDPLDGLPLTTRAEVQQDQLDHPPYGSVLTCPIERYTRLHQTSGSTGGVLRWLDTPESWQWWKRCWATVYRAAGITQRDRIVFPFSFGPFIGFWAAFESAVELGSLCLPAGGMTTTARLRYLLDNGVTVVCCTPTYALRMAEAAASERIDLADSSVRVLIVAGEPGGNIPGTRRRIETAWGARVFDHAGMTEVGAWGFECAEAPGGIHVMEHEFIAEVIDLATGGTVEEGSVGELVLTNLGRLGSPLIRYQTGDLVRWTRGHCACGRWFVRLEGGILGRADDMFFIRGNNVFPSAVEGIVREFPEVAEFRIEVAQRDAMSTLRIEVEPLAGRNDPQLADRLGAAIRDRLHFKPDVTLVPPGSLLRSEMKSRRFVRKDRGDRSA